MADKQAFRQADREAGNEGGWGGRQAEEESLYASYVNFLLTDLAAREPK